MLVTFSQAFLLSFKRFSAIQYNLSTLMTVLIVDDDAEDRELFCAALREQEDCPVCVELDSAEQLRLYLANAIEVPDFIFLDMHMPKINGLECVNELRKEQKYNKVQIIIYTTLISPALRTQFTDMNVKILVKSASYSELTRQVEKMIHTEQ
jgi:CheY-like chemotaxis protein